MGVCWVFKNLYSPWCPWGSLCCRGVSVGPRHSPDGPGWGDGRPSLPSPSPDGPCDDGPCCGGTGAFSLPAETLNVS